MDGTADGILALGEGDARKLLPGGEAAIAAAFRKLAKRWHPDRCPDARAGEVFDKLLRLKAAALRAQGAAPAPGRTEAFESADGRRYELRYRSRHAADGGEVFVGGATLCYAFDRDHADIARAAAARVATLGFANEAMRREMARFLPSVRMVVERPAGVVLVQGKTSDQFLLADLVRHCGGRIPPVHVAWIVSGLENLACYLGWAGLSHGAIDPFNVLVSPRRHSVALSGGWGFATPLGERPRALPGRTLAAAPRLAVPGVVADAALDLELVRLTARECLGDPSGGRLLSDPGVPRAMAQWLALPPAATALEDYADWPRALERSFGPRRFVEWELAPEELYGAA